MRPSSRASSTRCVSSAAATSRSTWQPGAAASPAASSPKATGCALTATRGGCWSANPSSCCVARPSGCSGSKAGRSPPAPSFPLPRTNSRRGCCRLARSWPFRALARKSDFGFPSRGVRGRAAAAAPEGAPRCASRATRAGLVRLASDVIPQQSPHRIPRQPRRALRPRGCHLRREQEGCPHENTLRNAPPARSRDLDGPHSASKRRRDARTCPSGCEDLDAPGHRTQGVPAAAPPGR